MKLMNKVRVAYAHVQLNRLRRQMEPQECSFPRAVRIGRGNHLGIPYYNLEIKTKYLRDERNIYRSLLETLSALMNRKLEGSLQEIA